MSWIGGRLAKRWPALKSRPAHARRSTLIMVRWERRVAITLRPVSLGVLRISLGLVFAWFGALKLADASPVGDLVARTVPWFDRSWFVPTLGAIEIALGFALLAGRFLTTVSVMLVVHLGGTFAVLVMQPRLAFRHNDPFLLTTVGEFVVKNIVLIAAGLVLASRLRDPQLDDAPPINRATHFPTEPVGKRAADSAEGATTIAGVVSRAT
jgi:putative oxidoreductase